ncbi:hypothetical protein BDW22DRAFT_33332 [Trametopsis cervina]|nr:hypothetical protein BDW22DRAFT_33332 [Trametopsis cervina]
MNPYVTGIGEFIVEAYVGKPSGNVSGTTASMTCPSDEGARARDPSTASSVVETEDITESGRGTRASRGGKDAKSSVDRRVPAREDGVDSSVSDRTESSFGMMATMSSRVRRHENRFFFSCGTGEPMDERLENMVAFMASNHASREVAFWTRVYFIFWPREDALRAEGYIWGTGTRALSLLQCRSRRPFQNPSMSLPTLQCEVKFVVILSRLARSGNTVKVTTDAGIRVVVIGSRKPGCGG